ncbi:23S rRNA (guanosine(2251)-2'-O)-methyltransferase RlmB [Geobacter hydrogenophilus]|uniref:23S rRNA (Guanosine(2251)-2'-O)-methyltransferase RlmB n=1 Tax=Geobacter hydrogenophilus TaxID=40983 RepID=A0A9W6FXJ6_9BACT|nr:23S rRNA (guanosine(2251)-2'-O)-methyltransferase RlmB [Geobacter hydrogenophilus]MBT0895171.1 23S rRNA (guanosine(2251)-2'-O)-methyltransferase RlmB [Geobacter hydrogenophilus]GLI36647.1 23S rRNA (guanosine(2251)-2'-O)-methyltransferase RlmB [Geobacter hydrogenophilus]
MKEEILYGINSAMEALRGKRRAFELFVSRDASDRRMEKLLKLAAEKGVPVRNRDKRDISRLCGTDHHQGVALRLEGFSYAELTDIIAAWRESGESGLILVLDGVQDPHNLGALIRSAACAGAHGVIIPKDRAARVTATVEKSAAGAAETIPVAQVTNLAQALDELKEAGFWIYGAADSAASSLYDQDLSGNVVVVIGSEGEGVRPLVRKKCDFLVAIPLRGGVSSLNASVAGGVILFEVLRQRLASTHQN